MTTYVALSSSTTRDYNFLLPLTALFWRDVIGIEPFCLLAGRWDSNNRTSVALKALCHHDFRLHWLPFYSSPYDESTMAQNVRQHAATNQSLGLDDDWLMPSDADLWPLRKDYYHQHEKNWKRATCLYSNGDHFQGKEDVLSKMAAGKPYQSIPTCSVVMRIRDWRERYELKSSWLGSSFDQTVKTLDGWLKPKMLGKTPSEASWEAWLSDQRIMTEKLCTADWFPESVAFVERQGHPPVDRLDRSSWPSGNIDYSRYIDAHLPRVPDGPENWPKLRALIERFLPQHLSWADRYQKEYRASYDG